MDPLRHHIEGIAQQRDVARLLRGAVTGDRTEPVAREWVRRWGPSPFATVLSDCSCAVGRCALCN